ncbi:receptor-like protein 7 [Triticum urartu]|uniref:receptor-like protein 7 n=1 Tax=Triticum urartu TaxID=4572 RepID=UPI002043CFC2|nr:receptor-like protein 7 [Triticum urartu]
MMACPKPFLLLLLLLLLQLQLVAVNSLLLSASTFANHTTALPECLPDQALALLRLKRSFSASNHSYIAFRSWKAGTDCCRWEGIGCHASTSHVTSLDLGDCGLESRSLDPAVFELTTLRNLNLGGNDFHMSEMPFVGFERLTMLTHLNLSTSNFSGQVPHSIGDLTNLVSLDLSFRFEFFELLGYGYWFHVDSSNPGQLLLSNLTTLVANLGNLRELHLSFVDLSSEGEEWCTALARYTPNLRVLSMPYCKLSSAICGSLSCLHFIRVIDLGHNHLAGPFPLFFANFSSLIVLQLSYNDIGGWVPPEIFQHKKLVTIDLHYNFRISGNLPKFPAHSNLENLLVGNTNFSGDIPSSISNLKSLKRLGLGSHGFAGKLP